MRHRQLPLRPGVAAVEVAAVTTFLLVPLMIGVWEIGRLVQVKQVVSTSAREGARRAAQGYTINELGIPTQVMVDSGSTSVKDAVYQSLLAAGFTNLQKSDIQVSFEFLAPRSDGAIPTEPYLGEKGQPFKVTVTVPWEKVRWINLGILHPEEVTFTVTWRMLISDKFTVEDTLPSW
jgi:hypothetical protein